MNIAMVGPFGLRPKGTMSARALPLARALVPRGHRVTMILPPWSHPQDSGLVSVDGAVQIINIALPPRLPLLFHLLITWRILRVLRTLRPNVVHCFKPKAYSGLAAFVLWQLKRLRLTSLRLVVDSDDWEGKGGWNEIERYSRLQKAFFAWQERWGLTHADAVTVASRALQTLVWSLGVPPARVHYVPNGAGPVADGTRTAPPDHTLLLYTRFFEFKVGRAVDILQRVLHEAPEARLLVVGAGLFGEEKDFLARISAAGLAERVAYAGWQDQSQLPAFFARAAVALYPFDDTLINRTKCAMKLIDLLAAGVPVVADRVGQNAEYIEHLVSGILVEPGDTTGFAAWVVRLLRDRELGQRLGRAAQQRIQQHYTWTRLAALTEDAYQ